MKTAKMLTILVVALVLVVCSARVSEAVEPMSTAFTYQGHLYDANYVADGLYDFQFKLWRDPCETMILYKVGNDVNIPDVDVIDGYFTVELDFNHPWAFDGYERWLEIGVRPGEMNDPNVYTSLSPRQEVTPVPYAFYSSDANDADFLDGLDSSAFASSSHSHDGSDIDSGTVDEGYIDADITRDTELTSGLATKADTVHAHSGSDITFGLVDEGYIDADITRDTELTSGLATKADISHDHDPCYVNVTGDTMTGNLTLDHNDLILDNGNISMSIGNITISGGTVTSTTISNYAVKGITSCDSGQGVRGEVSGTDASAVYGEATDSNSNDNTNCGGNFRAAGGQGVGVFGWATNPNSITNYGGYFRASGENGRGVQGLSDSSLGYGGYFEGRGYFSSDVGIGIVPTGRLQVAGGRVRIGDSGTANYATDDGDLYVEDALEVDGRLYVGNDVEVGSSLEVNFGLDVTGDFVDISDGAADIGYANSEGELYVENDLEVDGNVFFQGISAQAGATYVHVDGNGRLWKITSSKKYKTNIRNLNSDPMAVLELRPVKYQCRISGKEDVGLIAEEVEQVTRDLVIHNDDGSPEAVKYDRVALYLLAVVKAQQDKIAVLEESVAQNNSLKQRLGALERTMQLHQFASAKEVQQ